METVLKWRTLILKPLIIMVMKMIQIEIQAVMKNLRDIAAPLLQNCSREICCNLLEMLIKHVIPEDLSVYL